jgi:hypothetical protein
MVFLTFLASLAVLHWIVRKEPGLGKSNQSSQAANSSIENESALSTLDLASLARSLARECPKNAAPDEVLVKRQASQDQNVNAI